MRSACLVLPLSRPQTGEAIQKHRETLFAPAALGYRQLKLKLGQTRRKFVAVL